MNTLQELLSLNKELYNEISKPSPKNERDQLISKINEFLKKREGLIKSLQESYSFEEKLLGKEIIAYDRKIQEKFNAIKQEIKQDFITAKNQKRNTSKYISPYKSTITNGVFMDKRK